MNIISELRKEVNKSGSATLTIDQFNQLQAEWIKRTLPDDQIKEIAVNFYYDWHNSPGTNTQDGFDDWWEKNRGSWGQ